MVHSPQAAHTHREAEPAVVGDHYTITWLVGHVELPRPLGAWVQDEDGWWRELYTPKRDVWPGGFREEAATAFVRCSEPLGRIATPADIQRSIPREPA